MSLQNDFSFEVARRVLEQSQDTEYIRALALNILSQCQSQKKLLEMWMGISSDAFQNLESRRGE